jgi:3'-phosphoadenosine 5'-phosphosulfate synthase
VSPDSFGPSKHRFKASRVVGFTALSIFFTSLGFSVAMLPNMATLRHLANPPTDAETLHLYSPTDDLSKEIERLIGEYPLTKELRSNPHFTESRPHLKIPESLKEYNLTGGVLAGPGRMVVPPYFWSEEGGKSMVSIVYIGTQVCGHPGVIHGGMLATLLDEGLARCCFPALPNKIAMTANLNINYRKPAPAGSFLVLKAKTTKVEGRKAWVEGHFETLVGEGEQPEVLIEASAIFIEPRNAAVSPRIS